MYCFYRIEMGNVNTINTKIGTNDFYTQPVATQSDNLTCVSNCTLVNVTCSTLVSLVVNLMNLAGIKSIPVKCPLQFYKCSGNIVKLDKLVSGYYVGQELEDGTVISKPPNQLKCSHGGIVDSDSFKPSSGGINKDSGWYFLKTFCQSRLRLVLKNRYAPKRYLFSPHADLHLKAAALAIQHTEFYFNQIRQRIGDAEYATFLKLAPNDNYLNYVNQFVPICSRSSSNSLPITGLLALCSFLPVLCNNFSKKI
jgi:hypothetical protein